jgi:SAM-dependent methyltransferase
MYNSARLAEGYAFSRPPVHPFVIERVVAHRTLPARSIARALDVGCGAGRSTAALTGCARMTVGIEPAAAMLVPRRAVAPGASFVVGHAEALPFANASFELVTAAGSLNYTDRGRALPEIARVLAPGGVLAIYDFSSGRRCHAAAALATWFAEFEQRYPYPPGYALDVEALDYAQAGLRLAAHEPFEAAVPLTLDAYLAYVLSEANVERAITAGAAEYEIAAWCSERLAPLFGSSALTVLFSGYVAYVIADVPDVPPGSQPQPCRTPH